MVEHSSKRIHGAKIDSLGDFCSNVCSNRTTAPSIERDCLVQQLRVYQVELERQNEELRRTQEKLAEMLKKYSDLFNFAPVGYVILNKKGLILDANLTFADQLGMDRGRLINTLFWLHIEVLDRDTFWSHFDKVFKTRERHSCELKLKRENGQGIHVQLDTTLALKGDGTEICRTSVTQLSIRKGVDEEIVKIHNELERRVQERTAELWVSERKFKRISQEFTALLNAITDTLILISPEFEILWTNRPYDNQLNKPASDVLRQYCDSLLSNNSGQPDNSPVTRCFYTAKKEVTIETCQGTMLDIKAFPIIESGKVRSVLLLISDITEKITMQAEAMQAGSLASLGELAAGVAHEINNPITGIINYGQILCNDCRAESMEKDIGERIVREGERISRIVRSLLSYARDGRDGKMPVRVPVILDESIILTKAQIRKEGIDLEKDFPDDLPEVEANFQQIQQAFLNIINNARYALNEKYPERDDNKRLYITGEKVTVNNCSYVRIVFHDRGGGISAHEISSLTKPFFSTKPVGKGTGLGLSITKKIIMEHKGNIGFESVKGEFTKVIIDLPAYDHCGEEK